MNRNEIVREAIREYLAKRQKVEFHPEPDELAAYHDGELSAEDERRVQDHLLACRECASLLADLEGLGDPGFGAEEELPDNASELVWEKVREGIHKEPAAPAKVVPFPGKRRESRAPARRWLPLAASLLIATLALSAWMANQSAVEEPSSPHVVRVLDLNPVGSIQRGEERQDVETVAPGVQVLKVLLRPAGSSPFESYEAEVVDGQGRMVLTKGGLRYDPESDSFTPFFLSRDRLGPGDFRIRLVGIGPEGERKTVETYAFRIEGP
jgi:anti-sigma factor RsiW